MCIGDQQLWFGLNTKLLVKYFQLSMPEIFLKTKKKNKKKKKKKPRKILILLPLDILVLVGHP
jgi:hypothetical protein